MAPGRLTFLYPHLLRAVRAGTVPRTPRTLGAVRCNSAFARRRGTAVEPLSSPGEHVKSFTMPAAGEDAADIEGPEDDTHVYDADPAAEESDAIELPPVSEIPTEDAQPEVETIPDEERTKSARDEAKQSGPLEAVLHMQAPETVAKEHPAMTPPPYIHHFDTYGLVKELQNGGYSQAQATTAMKGIRTMLAGNLDVAQSSLVSKSDVENETYLFTAACSELSTEIKNNRRFQDEELRQQRTHLQHQVDVLTQSLNQELLTLNDNVRGMFNDRKMAVTQEQKVVESAVQQINYKISIDLSSDAKSDIEAVRWILIRRSVLGILFMAVLTLGTLRYATYVGQQRQKEADKKKKEDEERRLSAGTNDRTSAADAAVILAAN
ncbi:Fc.00g110730.m01.CDS01 [Cosmosporella sp. VM-42]